MTIVTTKIRYLGDGCIALRLNINLLYLQIANGYTIRRIRIVVIGSICLEGNQLFFFFDVMYNSLLTLIIWFLR